MAQTYKEKDSTFEANGTVYDLSKIHAAIKGDTSKEIRVSNLSWILKYIESTDKEKVDDADITKPILVTAIDSQEVVVEGLHRLQKAIKTNVLVLPYKRVSSEVMEESVIKPEEPKKR